MNGKVLGMMAAALSALGLALLWGPTTGRRVHAQENLATQVVTKREIHIGPNELAHLLYNRWISLRLLDLRDEPAFNTFHLIDAKRFLAKSDSVTALKSASPKTVTVLIDEDESVANVMYPKIARAGVKHVYVLEGGIRAWLRFFETHTGSPGLKEGALGDRHPASYPSLANLPPYTAKVKSLAAGEKKSAGCGG